ncbi:MAG TPA: NB-ARC domain-containing protein [Anaerolineae bacterium]
MMSPKFENPRALILPAEVRQIISIIFDPYKRIVLRKEYEQGVSGGRVIEVEPIKADGTPELPAIVKIAAISLIQKEWQAYRQHIRFRLHNAANITTEPVLLPEVGWGGLRYTLMGGGAFEVETLRDYLHRPEVNAEDARHVLDRLLRMMHNLWGHHSLQSAFQLRASYDHLLPVNLLVHPRSGEPKADVLTVTPVSLPGVSIEPGDYVRLSGFVVNKVNPDTRTVTLRQPVPGEDDRGCLVRWKVPADNDLKSYQLDQVVENLEGTVIETRMSRLVDEVRRALGDEFKATTEQILLPGAGGLQIANPLYAFPRVLEAVATVNVASIHGDLNLANILIEPETGLVSLIDFAEARADHVLHDLLRLETEITTHLLAGILHRRDWQPAAVLGYLYWYLHDASRQSTVVPPQNMPAELAKPWLLLMTIRQAARRYAYDAHSPVEYYRGLFLSLLGALKFKNLNTVSSAPLPKQLAFWGAALIYQFLIASEAELAMMATAFTPLPGRQSEEEIVRTRTVSPASSPAQESLDNHHARQQPAALPLGDIPPPAYLPPGSRMPLSRNPLFVGRKHDLRRLTQALKGNSGQVETAAITGLGGVGKTQLACEFVHRYGRFFPGGVFWLAFADAEAVAAEVAACGGAGFLNLRPDFAELPLAEQTRLVLAEWQRPLPRLLVFDNCEDPALLSQWRPTTGGCRILITSRRAKWDATLGVQTVALDVLPRAESLALLRQHYPDADDAALDAIAAEVADLPLALHLAGTFLARYRYTVSLEEYLERLQDPSLQPEVLSHDWGASPTDHVQNVSRTIALSYEQLDPSDSVDT